MAAQLDAISKRIDALKQGTLTLPTNINTFVTKEGKTGVGIEPTIGLDQEDNYINHLHQLRRVNAGDDLTDLAGYGLYLLRMPITLMPGPESRKGKGAIVTVEARHDLTDDLLPNTFRDVAILDLTYALTQIVNEQIHQDIYDKRHHPQMAETISEQEPQLCPEDDQMQQRQSRALVRVSSSKGSELVRGSSSKGSELVRGSSKGSAGEGQCSDEGSLNSRVIAKLTPRTMSPAQPRPL